MARIVTCAACQVVFEAKPMGRLPVRCPSCAAAHKRSVDAGLQRSNAERHNAVVHSRCNKHKGGWKASGAWGVGRDGVVRDVLRTGLGGADDEVQAEHGHEHAEGDDPEPVGPHAATFAPSDCSVTERDH